MSNMSYCRYENTLADLRDCAQAIEEEEGMGEALSETEAQAKEALIELCCDIAEQVGNARDYKDEPDCEACLAEHGIPKSYHGERDIYMEECNTCTK